MENRTTLPIPPEVPLLLSEDIVIYPSLIMPFGTEDEKVVKIIDQAVVKDKIIGIFPPSTENNASPIGTAALIGKMFKLPDGSIRAFLQGLARVYLKEITQQEPVPYGKVEVCEEKVERSTELEALVRNLNDLFQRVVNLAPNLPEEIGIAAMNISEPGNLADFIASNTNLKQEEKRKLLETLDVSQRIRELTSHLNRELEILELGSKIQSQIKGEVDKTQREYYLREQLKAIQKELGEVDERTKEIEELKEKMVEAKMPPEVQKEAERELDRLSRMPSTAPEYSISRTYLDWLVGLPWSKETSDIMDIEWASKVLDEDHYDLEKVKERVLEFLAVRKLKQDMKGPILCFVGPPGVGKTSLGKSIARALGRNFIHLSLGGIRDEAEIRGHRRTYVGALPGRIIQSLQKAKSRNPVFMLDEVDKMGIDFRGDPAAALLEVLDPEQNFFFVDHYLDVPFDLSHVMFITTANIVDPIPPALRDRMETIDLPGYTDREKAEIARSFLVPRQIEENGLSKDLLSFTPETIQEIIKSYTREAGVRNLEREIGSICRKVARKVAEGERTRQEVTPDKLYELRGPPKFRYEIAERKDEIGVATGLAWTPSGGEIILVETSIVPGKGKLILTGKLGEVMQESAKAALTYTRSIASSLGVDGSFHDKNDIHIHIPEGAIPKDGPSAGITMTISLISALSRRPVRREVGMTGEITLRGRMLPVGGIKEKVLAAHRAGLTEIILPQDNERDLVEIPPDIKGELKFVFAKTIDDIREMALVKEKAKAMA
jgi:ATP-dependent Lon protease